MMMKYDLAKNPGQWRPGAVWVQNDQGEVVYEAPTRDLVDGLVDELLADLAAPSDHARVTAAMAHLNLTLIHPFSEATVAQGSWSPQNDARPWLELCLTAHHRQAATLVRRVKEAEALWDRCEQLARQRALPDRVVGALCDASRGWRLRRSLYSKVTRSAAGGVG